MATDPVIIIGAATGFLSALLVLSASLIIWKRSRKLEEEIDNISQRQKQIREIENHILAEDPSPQEFEKTVSDLAERLFSIAKSKYGMDDVTTYQEMVDELDSLDEDKRVSSELGKFFEKVENLKYSEEGLSEAEKALIRQSAYNLIRKVEPNLEGQTDHKSEE
jgi:vacuolar-type H+-ATPase subunit I/STV1